MLRHPPMSPLTDTLFPSRPASDLLKVAFGLRLLRLFSSFDGFFLRAAVFVGATAFLVDIAVARLILAAAGILKGAHARFFGFAQQLRLKFLTGHQEIGRASGRERECQYV